MTNFSLKFGLVVNFFLAVKSWEQYFFIIILTHTLLSISSSWIISFHPTLHASIHLHSPIFIIQFSSNKPCEQRQSTYLFSFLSNSFIHNQILHLHQSIITSIYICYCCVHNSRAMHLSLSQSHLEQKDHTREWGVSVFAHDSIPLSWIIFFHRTHHALIHLPLPIFNHSIFFQQTMVGTEVEHPSLLPQSTITFVCICCCYVRNLRDMHLSLSLT